MSKVIAIIIFGLSLFWGYSNISLYYNYHYTDLLYAFRLPDWIIFIEIFLALLNIYKSIRLFIAATIIKRVIIIFGISIIVGFVIQIKYLMF